MKTEVVKIDPQNIDLEKIKKAAQVIKKGGIVAFPTETVYGLAADFFNKQAVDRIFEVKKRPKDKPLSVQIEDITYLEKLACDIPAFAYQLAGKFWPGPLTLVLPARPEYNWAGGKANRGGTIGVRIPDNKIARSLIKESATALVAPSANLSAEPAAKTAQELMHSFNGLIEMVIDSGPVELGIPSTVVDLTVCPYKILREGAISRKDLQSVRARAAVKTILLVCTGNSCRSVMAWGLLKKMLKERGDYKIMTAGTRAFKGIPPTGETIQVMSEQDIDVSGHRTSPLSDEILREADLILVMERAHKENILERNPCLRNKVHLLNEFGRIGKEDKLVDPDIPDPIGKPLDFYHRVLDIIKESIVRTAKKLGEQ
ncbi:MAG: threonylcarbamoyl-AMP synthase [Candidatus Omnitrophica bacterium]|nr:threonylcarbamoyl-AMP synthase [Candidatus Omnitrophota bacterium]MBU4141183.1 threonylcarbamoyl-AMP synthase [Candidatus Omnitrophota bacterium]